MRIGVVAVHVDPHRRGAHHRGVLQPQAAALIAGLLPSDAEIEVVNDAWRDPDWTRDYDLLFISCLHADFDRARQISHYWRRRGAATVIGGIFASTYPGLCRPWFDAVAVGDPESTVPRIVEDVRRRRLQPLYVAGPYDPHAVPMPRLDLMADQQLLPLSLEVTRGCPFACDFCGLTALGSRHHVRPVESVVRELMRAREMLAGVSGWHRRIAGFYDNNLGGNPGYLDRLCRALEPLGLRWGAAVTLNVIAERGRVARMAAGGCRGLFVGLESFNPATLADMGKHQNALCKVRRAIEHCHREGIVVMAGMVLSPLVDDLAYIAALPGHLMDCGLEVPAFVCFEAPIPGTPHFNRLAGSDVPMFLPNARLSDFTGYTLVTRPAHAGAEDFVAAYRELHRTLFSPARRAVKFVRDLAALAGSGRFTGAGFDLFELLSEERDIPAFRTLLAGTDPAPPELHRVPFAETDFRDERERAALLGQTPVTDAAGCALPAWLGAGPIYGRRGAVGPAAAGEEFADFGDMPAATWAYAP